MPELEHANLNFVNRIKYTFVKIQTLNQFKTLEQQSEKKLETFLSGSERPNGKERQTSFVYGSFAFN